jgi:hypothetical protein
MMLRRTAVVAVLLLAAAGCGGSSGEKAATPRSAAPTVDAAAADRAAITAAWEGFFTAGGSVASHAALLQDGAKFTAELTAAAKDPAAANLSAKVTNVVVTGTTAAVTYDLLGAGGAVLLGGSTGEAVKVGGRWVVSKKTYCQLVSLQNSAVPHPACA